MSASITTTGGHRVSTAAFVDADRYGAPDQAFRDKLITDNRVQEGQLIWYAPTKTPMFLETLVPGDPANSVWKPLVSDPNYKGDFTLQSNLRAAIPVGQPGWFAIIDTASQDAYKMIWDETDGDWVRSGSNVIGITAQQAADIESNNAARVTTAERSKWNNKVKRYTVGEEFTADMVLDGAAIVRLGANNRLYEFQGSTFPFTCVDLTSEATQTPSLWQVLGASFPPFELISISRTQLSPDTTIDVYIRGLLVTGTEVVTIGAGIVNINNISFVKLDKEPVIIVNITTPTTLHNNLQIIVDNGSPVILAETFTVSNGVEYIPAIDSSDAPFVVNSGDINDLIFGVGSIRNLNGVAGQKVIKIDLDVPTNQSFLLEWTITTNNNGETSEGDVGFANKIAPATGRSTLRYGWFHQGFNFAYFGNYGSIGQVPVGGGSGGSYMLKGTLNVNNKYDVEWFQNGTLYRTLSNQEPDEVLNVFFMTNTLTTHENIKLTII